MIETGHNQLHRAFSRPERSCSFVLSTTHTELSPDKENVFVRADLVFEGDDEDTDPGEIVEMGRLRFSVHPWRCSRFTTRGPAEYPSWTTNPTTSLRLPTSSTASLLNRAELRLTDRLYSRTQHEDGCDDSPGRSRYAHDLGEEARAPCVGLIACQGKKRIAVVSTVDPATTPTR